MRFKKYKVYVGFLYLKKNRPHSGKGNLVVLFIVCIKQKNGTTAYERETKIEQSYDRIMGESFFFGKVKTKNEESRIASLIGKNHMQFFFI